MTKICFAASSGGHLEQLMRLKPLMDKYDSFIVTEKFPYDLQSGKKTYYLHQINRHEALFPFKLLGNLRLSAMILMREKPDIVISTGVLATIPICLLARLKHKKLIYIESFAMVEHGTLTGRLLYRYADRFYVQWEEMLKEYPDAICLGGIY